MDRVYVIFPKNGTIQGLYFYRLHFVFNPFTTFEASKCHNTFVTKRPIMSNCFVCNSVIKSNRRGKKYCSNACKQRAYYVRKHGLLAPTINRSPFDVYKMVRERLGSDYDLPFMEFLFIKSCNPFITELDDLVMLVKDSIDNSYDYRGQIEPAYKHGLESFTKRWFDKGVGRLG